MSVADQIHALLEELPGYWVESRDIAECVGASVQQASRIAARLAKDGRIEQRVVHWRASRCRVRERYEFRTTPGTGQRLPAWIEPPVYPIDPNHCRLIVGRNSLTKEIQPMTETEFRALPSGVRVRFQAIEDRAFEQHGEVIAAREHLEACETKHRRAAEEAHKVRTRRAQVENLAGVCREARINLHATRRQLVADALAVAGTDVSIDFDAKVRDEIERMDLVIDSVPVAIANIDAHLVELNRRTQAAARDVEAATDAVRATLDKLKLAEAWRQYG